jgi:hypothetical protein
VAKGQTARASREKGVTDTGIMRERQVSKGEEQSHPFWEEVEIFQELQSHLFSYLFYGLVFRVMVANRCL